MEEDEECEDASVQGSILYVKRRRRRKNAGILCECVYAEERDAVSDCDKQICEDESETERR